MTFDEEEQFYEAEDNHHLEKRSSDNLKILKISTITNHLGVSSIINSNDHVYTSLSDSLASLYLPPVSPHLRQLASSIMSGLNWINQFELNQSSLLHYIHTLNPFRRRSSTPSISVGSKGNHNNNNNQDNNSLDVGSSNSNTLYTKSIANILNQRGKTLKKSELIELSNFGLVEVENIESGIGHEFTIYEDDRPTWCDSCGEFLTTPVMTSSNANDDEKTSTTSEGDPKTGSNNAMTTAPAAVQVDQIMRTYLECRKCKYVCHPGCVQLIRINCAGEHAKETSPTETRTTPVQEKEIKQETARNVPREEDGEKIDSNNNHNSSDSSRSDSLEETINTTSTTSTTSTEESCAISLTSSSTTQAENIALDNDGSVDQSRQTMGNNASDHVHLASHEMSHNEAEKTEAMITPPGPAQTITPKVIVNLKGKICRYNERLRGKGSGLGVTLIDADKQFFRGFLRVHMNLTRPINVVSGKRPPSIYDIINEQQEEKQNQRRTLTSFYMPRDTVKNIHIDSENTSLQVIKAMLKKFKVVDNPQKFALYLRRRMLVDETKIDAANESDAQGEFEEINLATIKTFLSRSCSDHSLRRLSDNERPLVLQLEFDSYSYGAVDIVLQENDNADIAWDAFKVPELHNFLRILDREEEEHLRHVKIHYDELKCLLNSAIQWRMGQTSTDAAAAAADTSVLV